MYSNFQKPPIWYYNLTDKGTENGDFGGCWEWSDIFWTSLFHLQCDVVPSATEFVYPVIKWPIIQHIRHHDTGQDQDQWHWLLHLSRTNWVCSRNCASWNRLYPKKSTEFLRILLILLSRHPVANISVFNIVKMTRDTCRDQLWPRVLWWLYTGGLQEISLTVSHVMSLL